MSPERDTAIAARAAQLLETDVELKALSARDAYHAYKLAGHRAMQEIPELEQPDPAAGEPDEETQVDAVYGTLLAVAERDPAYDPELSTLMKQDPYNGIKLAARRARAFVADFKQRAATMVSSAPGTGRIRLLSPETHGKKKTPPITAF